MHAIDATIVMNVRFSLGYKADRSLKTLNPRASKFATEDMAIAADF
jgi:hypothetical protein